MINTQVGFYTEFKNNLFSLLPICVSSWQVGRDPVGVANRQPRWSGPPDSEDRDSSTPVMLIVNLNCCLAA